jgi:Sec-independent protein translocase protein TatA
MELFGVGAWEVVAILIIMLIVAGPKRMIGWAYQLGVYTRKFRAMFSETMAQINKEVEASGVDVRKDLADLPRIPTRFDIVNEASKIITGNETSTTGTSQTNLPDTNDQSSKTGGEESQSRYDAWTPN